MSNRNLVEMEASDMMDCLHFLFEEDFTSVSEEHARSRSAIRDVLYSDMYGVSYPYKMKDPPKSGRSAGTASNSFQYPEDDFESFDTVQPFDPKKNDVFSPRADTDAPKRKIAFVDASSVPLIDQSFDGLDAPLN